MSLAVSTLQQNSGTEHLLLGKGSNSTGVYAFQNPVTGSSDAVKVCHGQNSINSAYREYEILTGRLKNAPHTVRVKGFSSTVQKAELMMERLKGLDLVQLVTQCWTKMVSKVFFDIAKKGLEALRFYQSEGLVHADIKPENCSYDFETKEFRIFDFGQAFFSQKESQTGIGTLSYCAPERLLGKPAHFGSDMWAFGVTLFNIYTASHMFLLSGHDSSYKVELVCLFQKQFGASFLEYLGVLIVQKDSHLSFDEIRKTFKNNYIQSLSQEALNHSSQTINLQDNTPWRDRIRQAAITKGEAPQAERIIRFLEKIFTFENRMTAEEGLRMFSPSPSPAPTLSPLWASDPMDEESSSFSDPSSVTFQ